MKEKCRQIEENNKMGITRDLYREIKRDDRILQFKMWSHEAEHREGGNGREGGERNVAAIHGRTVQTQTQRTPSTKTYMRTNLR